MLLWEALLGPKHQGGRDCGAAGSPERPQRLPFDTRCPALTKAGRRCRSRVRPGGEWCVFHDPDMIAARKRRAADTRRRPRRFSHIPGGYLRKLTSRQAVGQAMDRLYREIRLGIITPPMGRVLLDVLCRILDSGIADAVNPPKAAGRTKAAKMRPRLEALLTDAELAAWRKAVREAPDSVKYERVAPPAHETEERGRQNSVARAEPYRVLPGVRNQERVPVRVVG